MVNTHKVKLVYQKGFAQTKQQLNEPRLKKVLEITQDQSSKPVDILLDIGCGDGFFTQELSKILKPKEVYGIDISKEAVQSLNSKIIKGFRIDVDESDLPYSSNFFDFVYCGNLIELVADADHLLKEIYRTLKKGGTAIITFPNMASWLSRIALLFGYLPYYSRVSTQYYLGKMFGKITSGKSTGFIRLFTLSSFKKLVNLYGFQIYRVYGSTEKTLPFPVRYIDTLFSKIPTFAFQVIVILKK